MSLNQVQLALKNATSKSRTPIRPYLNSIWEIIKTSHVQIFLFFSIMERIRKGSDLPKKKSGGHRASNKNYLQIKLPQGPSALYFVEFWLGARAWNTWRGTRHAMYSVRSRDAQKQWANVLKTNFNGLASATIPWSGHQASLSWAAALCNVETTYYSHLDKYTARTCLELSLAATKTTPIV